MRGEVVGRAVTRLVRRHGIAEHTPACFGERVGVVVGDDGASIADR
jgi:hypothetical protein